SSFSLYAPPPSGSHALSLHDALPILAPADPIKTGFATRVRPPSILGYESGFWLGSDNLGRDVLSRILYGGRISLWVAARGVVGADRKSTRLNSSHQIISYAVFCLQKK